MDVDGPIVAMTSGGADSTLLAVVLVEQGCDVRLLHVAHGLRGAESEADAEACRALAARLDVRISVVDGRVAPGGNLEARLRDVRRAAAARPARAASRSRRAGRAPSPRDR